MTDTQILAVDIGQTGFRVRVDDGEILEVPVGVDALTDDGRVRSLAARILEQVDPHARITHAGVGLSGFVEDSPAPAHLAGAIREGLGARSVSVAADAVTAFLGTVGAQPGTIAICGTGVAALGLGAAGAPRRIDARGYLLGDFGGGFWLGQRGLHAALDAREGRGESTTLAAASARLGTPQDIYRGAMASTPAPKYIAGFAPDVLAAAEQGDTVASRILADGADHLARSILAARLADGPIGLTGGLTRAPVFVSAVTSALAASGLGGAELIVRPDAALEGARVLAAESSIRPAFAGLLAVKESE